MRLLVHDYAGHPFQIQLSRQLARRGHHVTHAYAGQLLTPRGALARRDDDPPNLDIVEVPMSERYKSAKYNFVERRNYEFAYGAELTRLIKRLQPDLVISGNTPSEPQWRMIQSAQALGVPIVSWVQDFYSIAVSKLARKKAPVLGLVASAYYRWLDAKCLRASAGVVAISDEFRPLIEEFGVAGSQIVTIPNWAPLDEITPQPKHNDWCVRHGLDGKFVFLYTGTLAMKHNPAILAALAEHFRDDPEVRVVVISDGPGADFLREAKQSRNLDNLVLLPFQDFADMPNVLGTADVLVAVLERDAGIYSVPSKVLTYHAAGKAILEAVPGENLAARIVRDQGSGLCVEPDDCDGFIKAAQALRGDAARREEMAHRARAYAVTEFDIESIATKFENTFASAISRTAA